MVRENGSVETTYMNGENIRRRTNDLIDQLWSKLFYGIIGAWLFICGLIFSFIFLNLVGAILCLIVITCIAWLIARPFIIAYRELRKHRRMIEAETRRLGPGWAKS